MRPSDALLLNAVRVSAELGDAKRTRLAARLSLSEMGAACRVAPSTVSRWERGLLTPRGPAGLRYARMLARLEDATRPGVAS